MTQDDAATVAQSLPGDAVLLHIGFHKTGTTAIQDAFAAARPQLKQHGVVYPGPMRHHHRPALAMTEKVFGWTGRGGREYEMRQWKRLERATQRASGRRVVISSEFFAEAQPEVAQRIVEGLDRRRVHVVATVRGLDRILPSSWQQYLKRGIKKEYEAWLKAVLADPPHPKVTPNFWKRHLHAEVMAKWADIVGPENVTVIVVSDTDRSMLYRSFEQLVGLPDGLLSSQPKGRENRSLSAAEAEVLRRLNVALVKPNTDWVPYQALIREGAVRHLVEARKPGPDEAPIVTPQWAIDRAVEIAAGTAEGLRRLGVNIIGDLDALARPGRSKGAPDGPAPSSLPIDAAVEFVLGTVAGATGRKSDFLALSEPTGDTPEASPAVRPVADLPAKALLGVVARRGLSRLRRARP